MGNNDGHNCLELVKKDIEYMKKSFDRIEIALGKLPDQFAGKWVEKTFNKILLFIILATLAAVLSMIFVQPVRGSIAKFITFNYNTL